MPLLAVRAAAQHTVCCHAADWTVPRCWSPEQDVHAVRETALVHFSLLCPAFSICHGAVSCVPFLGVTAGAAQERAGEPARAWQKGVEVLGQHLWLWFPIESGWGSQKCSTAVITSAFLLPSFGVIPSTPLAIHTPLMPNQSIDVSLPLNTLGPVMKMEPLNNLQVRIAPPGLGEDQLLGLVCLSQHSVVRL